MAVSNASTQKSAVSVRSEEHTSELQSHSEISYAVFCLKKKKKQVKSEEHTSELQSHSEIAYAVFCLTKENGRETIQIAFESPLHRGFDTEPSALNAAVELLQRQFARVVVPFFFFNDQATTEIYTLSYTLSYTTLFRSTEPQQRILRRLRKHPEGFLLADLCRSEEHTSELQSHSEISYAVFCLKKKT